MTRIGCICTSGVRFGFFLSSEQWKHRNCYLRYQIACSEHCVSIGKYAGRTQRSIRGHRESSHFSQFSFTASEWVSFFSTLTHPQQNCQHENKLLFVNQDVTHLVDWPEFCPMYLCAILFMCALCPLSFVQEFKNLIKEWFRLLGMYFSIIWSMNESPWVKLTHRCEW